MEREQGFPRKVHLIRSQISRLPQLPSQHFGINVPLEPREKIRTPRRTSLTLIDASIRLFAAPASMDSPRRSSTRHVSQFFTAKTNRGLQVVATDAQHHHHGCVSIDANAVAETHGSTPVEAALVAEVREEVSPAEQFPIITIKRATKAHDEPNQIGPVQDVQSQQPCHGTCSEDQGLRPMQDYCHISDTRRKTTTNLSPFFKPAPRMLSSCLYFPNRQVGVFGLIQERLAKDPFCLMIAVIFLHQTKGAHAVPILLSFIDVFNSPESLSIAAPEDIAPFIRHLGLQNRRARILVELAKAWLENPPIKGRRYRYLHYPHHGSGTDVNRVEQPLEDGDPRTAWEIAHLPGIGPYALDSWRIFCRDSLRGLPHRLENTSKIYGGDTLVETNPEWTRVLPLDKELRVYLQWRWIRMGWLWDPLSGRRLQVGEDVIQSMERLEITDFEGFVNPWLSNVGVDVPEEQTLGGFRDESLNLGKLG